MSRAGVRANTAAYYFDNDGLLTGEAQGLAVDFTATTDFALQTWQMQAVQNKYSAVTGELKSPHTFFTQSGTSPKYVKNSATTIGWSPHNLGSRSQEIDNSYWTNFHSSETANATTAPDGTATADQLIEDSFTSFHTLHHNTSLVTVLANTTYCVSGYVKRTGGSPRDYQISFVNSSFAGGFGSEFDLDGSGTLESGNGGIVDVGNGWFRVWAYGSSGSETSMHINMAMRDKSQGDPYQYTGDSASGLYLWGFQIARGEAPLAYIATTTAAKIGLPISYGEGLLVEPAATNVAVQSQDITTSWSLQNGVRTANQTAAPDGSTTADQLADNSTGTNGHEVYIANGDIGTSVTRTMSVYLKAGTLNYAFVNFQDNGGGTASVGAVFDLSNGTVGETKTTTGGTLVGATITSVGNGWYRCAVTGDVNVGGAYILVGTAPMASGNSFNASGEVQYVGSGGTIFIWGVQYETGTVATSYVPTVGATATRAADTITVALSAFPYSATAGSTVQSFRYFGDAAAATLRQWEMNDGTTNEIIRMNIDNTATPDDATSLNITDGGVAQGSGMIPTENVNTSAGNIAAGSWALNDMAVCCDGGTVLTDTSATLPTVTTLCIACSNITADRQMNGLLRYFVYVPRAMSDAELQAATT